MSSDLKRISVYPDDAAFLRDVCDELGLDQAKAVAHIFEDFRKWEAVDDKPRPLSRLRKNAEILAISGVRWRSAGVWRADLWISAVLSGENHAVGQTLGMTTPRQPAASAAAPGCRPPRSR